MHPGEVVPSGASFFWTITYEKKMLSTSKHRLCDTTALVRSFLKPFYGIGIISTICFSSPKGDSCWLVDNIIFSKQGTYSKMLLRSSLKSFSLQPFQRNCVNIVL